MTLAAIADLADRAREKLPQEVWDFVAGGSGDERARIRNSTVIRSLAVVPRTCRGLEDVDPGVNLFGYRARAAVVVAPMAQQGAVHPEAETAAATGAARAGVPFTWPMLSTSPWGERPAVNPRALWYQLYWLRDRDVVAKAIDAASEAGSGALVLSVDMPSMARRPRDLRNGYVGPRPALDVSAASAPPKPVSRLIDDTRARMDPMLTWDDVGWVRSRTDLPLVVKGVLHPDDARAALDSGADGLVLSNHGGRQSPTAPSAIEVLPAVRERVDPAVPVLVDGGIASGDDVLVALALGATAVMVGRPVLWALALGGADGVSEMLGLLREELNSALHLVGCATTGQARELDVISATWPSTEPRLGV